MEQPINYLYEFVMLLLEDFQPYMSDIAYSQMISGTVYCIISVFVGGIISATWGACGALATLRRSKRG